MHGVLAIGETVGTGSVMVMGGSTVIGLDVGVIGTDSVDEVIVVGRVLLVHKSRVLSLAHIIENYSIMV